MMKAAIMTCGAALGLMWGLAEALGAQGNLYVVNDSYSTVGEYGMDGQAINASLISAGLFDPVGIAISGNDVFVANSYGNNIGEYTTAGATIDASLISGLHDPVDIAISSVPERSTVVIAGVGSVMTLFLICRRRV